MKRYILIPFLLSSLLVSVTFAQNNLKMHFEPDNWTQDMKNAKLTTEERGLKIRIDFTNLDTENYLTISYIKIRIESKYEESEHSEWDYIELKNWVIQPSNTTSTYHDIDLHRSGDSVGKWSVRLKYVTRESDWNFDDKIEPYPYEFKVVSDEEELQRQLKENPSAPIINIYITTTVTLFSVGILAWYLFKKKR